MGYNPLDVSAGKGNTTKGPIQYNPNVQTNKISFSTNFTTGGWLRLGEGATEGIESTQEATATDKRVWGNKSLGTTFSEFKDTVLTRFASAFDSDVLGVVFGTDNVRVSDEELLTIVNQRTPGFGTFVWQMKLDDGRDHWLVVPAGQPDPNTTRTFNDSDIVIIETTITASEREIITGVGEDAESFLATHYELTQPLAAE